MTNDQDPTITRRFDLNERTRKFALRIIKMFTALPKNPVARVLGEQVLRSGTSVGANYCEADAARSKAEFISKMGDSLKELAETIYWLELLVASGSVRAAKTQPLISETKELRAIFAAIIQNARKRGIGH
jgi:four helix bundle protein